MNHYLPIRYLLWMSADGMRMITLDASFSGDGETAPTWTIRAGTSCFSKSRQGFFHEPLPSNRDEDFYTDCRFVDQEDAVAAWETFRQTPRFKRHFERHETESTPHPDSRHHP